MHMFIWNILYKIPFLNVRGDFFCATLLLNFLTSPSACPFSSACDVTPASAIFDVSFCDSLSSGDSLSSWANGAPCVTSAAVFMPLFGSSLKETWGLDLGSSINCCLLVLVSSISGRLSVCIGGSSVFIAVTVKVLLSEIYSIIWLLISARSIFYCIYGMSYFNVKFWILIINF